MSSPLVLRAHAKLNLALSVGAPRPDGPHKGFHPIASWFAPIELHDTVELVRLPDASESVFTIAWATDAPRPTPIDWPLENDLAVRAHALLEQRAGRTLPVAVTVRKRIPVGGGLGGGSSDAAAALVGLNRLFDLGIPIDDLRALGARLGSDVAFFLGESGSPSAAIVSGLGERVERLGPTPAHDVLLVIPPFGCPTGPVYQAFDRSTPVGLRETHVRALAETAARTGIIDSAALFNDLAAPACVVEPRLREALDLTRSALGLGEHVHITGSGSTMFILLPPGRAEAAETLVRLRAPGLATERTRLI